MEKNQQGKLISRDAKVPTLETKVVRWEVKCCLGVRKGTRAVMPVLLPTQQQSPVLAEDSWYRTRSEKEKQDVKRRRGETTKVESICNNLYRPGGKGQARFKLKREDG